MLVQLPHVSNVGNNGQAKLLCHETDGKKLAHPGQPSAVRLNEMHSSVLKEVLEEDAVRDVFAGGNSYRCDRKRELGVRMHIVRVSGLLNPEWFEAYEFTAHAVCDRQAPILVRV